MKSKCMMGWLSTSFLGLALVSGFAQAEEPAPMDIALGVQVWGQTCARCHNAPPPNAFRDEDWKIIGHHMKLRANLTDPEIKAVLAFLQSAN